MASRNDIPARRTLRQHAVRAARMTYLGFERSQLAPLLNTRAVQRLKAWVTYMPESRVIAVLDLLADADVDVWVAGGWGVDALVGRQTRRHYDLDLVISDLPEHYLRLAAVLTSHGFRPSASEYTTGMPMPLRNAWMHDDGHCIEVMPVPLREPPFAPGRGGPAGPPFAHGRLGGRTVPCLSARLQLLLHEGYPAREIDAADIGLLRKHADDREGTVRWRASAPM